MQTQESQVQSTKDFVISPDKIKDFSEQHGERRIAVATFAEEARNTIQRGGTVEVIDDDNRTRYLHTIKEVDAWENEELTKK